MSRRSWFGFVLLASIYGQVGNAQPTPPIAPKVEVATTPSPVTLPPGTPPTDVPNRPLTVDEAVRIALRHQPDIVAARAGIAVAQGRTQQTRSGLLPNVTVDAQYNHTETLSTEGRGSSGGTAVGPNGATQGFQGTAVLRQLLFDFNHTRDLVRQSALLERAASENLSKVQEDLVFNVKQAYYGYIQATDDVTISEENLTNRQSQRDLARARLNSGLGLPADLVTAETAVDEAINELTVSRANETVARVNLALTMGIDPLTPIVVNTTTEPPVTSNNVDGLVRSALTQRPEIREAEANLKSAQYGVNAAKTTSAPSIAANVGFLNRGEDIPPGSSDVSVGVSLQWTPFDGGFTAGKVKEARANVDIAQAQLASVRLGVVSDVSQAFVNLRSAEQRVITSNTEVANAQESLRIAEGRFRSGLGVFQDILTAQAALVTARTNQANASFAVNQARSAVLHAIGAPLPPIP